MVTEGGSESVPVISWLSDTSPIMSELFLPPELWEIAFEHVDPIDLVRLSQVRSVSLLETYMALKPLLQMHCQSPDVSKPLWVMHAEGNMGQTSALSVLELKPRSANTEAP